MVQLTLLESLSGITSLIIVIISFVISGIMIAKYFKYHAPQLLWVGITWICLVSPYLPAAISFIMNLTTGVLLDPTIYYFLAIFPLRVGHILWMMAITDFIFKDKKKIILVLIIIEALLFEIFFIYFLILDPDLIGTNLGPFYVRWSPILSMFLVISMLLFLITTILFARESMKAKDKSIRLKGRFILAAVLIFIICVALDGWAPLNEITLVIVRMFLVLANLSFYIGFTLPNFIRKVLLHEKSNS